MPEAAGAGAACAAAVGADLGPENGDGVTELMGPGTLRCLCIHVPTEGVRRAGAGAALAAGAGAGAVEPAEATSGFFGAGNREYKESKVPLLTPGSTLLE